MKLKMKSILIILTSTIFLSAIHFTNNVVADDKPKIEKEQVGRFQLQIVKKGDENILYRIDTATGIVSVFDPTSKMPMLDSDWEQLGSKAESMKEWAKEVGKEGKAIFKSPYWQKLPEKFDGITVLGK